MASGRWAIPTTWRWVSLAEIAIIAGGGTPPASDESNFDENGIPWITPADLTGHEGTFISRGRRGLSQQGFDFSSARMLPEGAVLFSSRAPIGYCAIASNPLCTSQGFKSLILKGGINAEYARHYMLSSVEYAESKASGTTFKELSTTKLGELMFPLPPLAEQARISSKIDAIKSTTRQLRSRLNVISRLVANYRGKILDSAVRGDLTVKWREQNSGKLHESSDLSKQIATDREASYEAQLKSYNKKVEVAEKGLKPKRALNPEAATPEQIAGRWELPASWQWSQIGSVSFVTKLAGFEYSKFVNYDPSGDLRVIKAENIGLEGFKETEYSRVKSGDVVQLQRTNLEGNELLVVFVGAGIGQVAFAPPNQKFFLGPNVALVRPYGQAVSPRYIELFLRSSVGKHLLLLSGKAVAQASLSMGAIRSTPIALPSSLEQDEIIQNVDAAFRKIDAVTRQAADAHALINRLEEVAVAKAFRGELLPQIAGEEAAEVVLQRIKELNQSQPTGMKKKVRPKAHDQRSARMPDSLKKVLLEAPDWLSAQEAFRLCGVGKNATTEEIEPIYAELRSLDHSGQLMVKAVRDSDGKKLHDLIKLKTWDGNAA
jgi:type I restriction enzyme S subunit